MKHLQYVGQKIITRATISFLLCLIIAALLAACSGASTPPEPSTNSPAVSQDSAVTQDEAVTSQDSAVTQDEAATSQDSNPNEEEADSQDSVVNQDNAASQDGSPNQEGVVSKDSLPGSEEFGLTKEGLVTSIESVEALIAECMSENGFEYIPVDYLTVRKAMVSDKSAAGLSDEEYRNTFGYGISTRLDVAGAPPQLAGPDTTVQIGLGEQNIQIFSNLSKADQDAYNHTLFGENVQATFAYTLEAEDFSETGGCTRSAIEQVFSPEQMTASYYNPGDALIEQDPRVIEAIANWSNCMRQEGFDYNNPEEVEPNFKDRLKAILDGAPPETLSSEAQAALTELQGEERVTAVRDLECEEEFIDPVVQQVETELYSGPQN